MMHSLVGPIDDSFALFATSAGPGRYDVVIWPPIEGLAEEFSVGAAKLMIFLVKRLSKVERFGPTLRPDVFVHSLSEDEIRLLVPPADESGNPEPFIQRAA